MTVESYLQAKIPGYPFTNDVLMSAAVSPIMAKPTALKPLSLDDELEEVVQDGERILSLKYAESTLYYAISGVFSGGSKTEQVGDVKVSLSGFTITQADRDYYRSLADAIRDDLNCEQEINPTSDNGMFDASSLAWRTSCL